MNLNVNRIWKFGRIFSKDLTKINIFNNYLNIYLKIFNACFSKSINNYAQRRSPLITRGIKISCHKKRILYMSCKGNNDKKFKIIYKKILQNINRRYKKSTKLCRDIHMTVRHLHTRKETHWGPAQHSHKPSQSYNRRAKTCRRVGRSPLSDGHSCVCPRS